MKKTTIMTKGILMILTISMFCTYFVKAQAPVEGKFYKIKNVSASSAGTDLFIGLPTDQYARITSTGIGDVFYTKKYSSSTFNLLQMSSGKYLAKQGGWDGVFSTNSGDNNAQFKFVQQGDGTTGIQCMNNNGYIGADAITDGSQIYMNKGVGNNGKWIFVEYVASAADSALLETYLAVEVQILKTNLLTKIAEAQAIYDVAVAGAEPGQYTGKTEFLIAIVAAQAAHDDASATLESLTQAIDDLQDAITVFQQTVIEVTFAPTAGAYYRIYTEDQTRWANQYLYTVATTNDAGLKHAVITNETDSAYLFQFVQNGVFWNIIPAADVNLNAADMRFVYERGSGGSGMQAKAKKNPGSAGNFTFTFIKRVDGVDYYSAKSASNNWLFFGANGNDLKSMATYGIDPGVGSVPASFHFAIIKVDPFSLLLKAINEATNSLSNAVVGTGIGEYPQSAIDSLQNILNQAQTIYNNLNSTTSEIDEVKYILQGTLSWFSSQVITFATQFFGHDWNIVHSSGNLLSKASGESAYIYTQNKPGATQDFRIVPVIGQIGVVSIKSLDGKYLKCSGWNTLWNDSIDADTYIKLSLSSDNTINIKFVNKASLGTDTPADSAIVYADKSGTNINHKWQIAGLGQVVKIRLQFVIQKAITLKTATSAGTANYQFPQTSYNALSNAIIAATTIFDNVDATQENVDNQVNALNNVIENYYKAQILPKFTPEVGKKYIIKNKKNIGYFNNNGTNAVVEEIPPLDGWSFEQVRDSVWVFKSGSLALASSLNMVNYDNTQSNQHWYVHYDGLKENDVYVKDTVDTKIYFGFSENGTFINGIQQSSTGLLQIVSSHNHADQSQWFTIIEITAPITDGLVAKIDEVEAFLSTVVVGTNYGNYTQEAKTELENALAEANSKLASSGSMTQAQINTATADLAEALRNFLNQKIVWTPSTNMAYFIGNRDNPNFLSIDTLDISVAKGYKMDSTSFTNQLWFFVPVADKAGYYQLTNGIKSVGTSGGTNVFIQDYNSTTASQIEVNYLNTTSSIEYFALTTSNTYPNIHIDANGSIGTDRFTYNNYQIKLVEAGALRTGVLTATQLLNSVTVGLMLGETPQSAYDTFLSAINSAYNIATDNDDSNDESAVSQLLIATQAFRESENGYGLNLDALRAAVDEAKNLIESTTIIGNDLGQCPQTTIDALQNAITTALTVAGSLVQLDIDNKVAVLLADISTFESSLKISTGLAELIVTAQQLHDAAVEGDGGGQYAPNSKASLQSMINAASQALSAIPVSQTALLSAVAALNQALDNFNSARNPDVQFEDLLEVIALVEEFLKDKSATEYQILRTKLALAKTLSTKIDASQTEVDNMTEELMDLLSTASSSENILFDGMLSIYSTNNTILIQSNLENCKINIYDTTGKLILHDIVSMGSKEYRLDANLYIILASDNQKRKAVKKVVVF